MSGLDEDLAVGYTIGAVVAGIAYAAVFLLLAVVSRHAVVIGLIYALVWESLVGSFVPGAQTLSIQQWALSITDRIVDHDAVEASVRLAVAVPLVVAVTVGATWLAVDRLRSLTLNEAE